VTSGEIKAITEKAVRQMAEKHHTPNHGDTVELLLAEIAYQLAVSNERDLNREMADVQRRVRSTGNFAGVCDYDLPNHNGPHCQGTNCINWRPI